MIFKPENKNNNSNGKNKDCEYYVCRNEIKFLRRKICDNECKNDENIQHTGFKHCGNQLCKIGCFQHFVKFKENKNGKKRIVQRFRLCKGCRCISYCSRKCQKIDWLRHKKECDSCKFANQSCHLHLM